MHRGAALCSAESMQRPVAQYVTLLDTKQCHAVLVSPHGLPQASLPDHLLCRLVALPQYFYTFVLVCRTGGCW